MWKKKMYRDFSKLWNAITLIMIEHHLQDHFFLFFFSFCILPPTPYYVLSDCIIFNSFYELFQAIAKCVANNELPWVKYKILREGVFWCVRAGEGQIIKCWSCNSSLCCVISSELLRILSTLLGWSSHGGTMDVSHFNNARDGTGISQTIIRYGSQRE